MKSIKKEEQTLKKYINSLNKLLIELIFNESKLYFDIEIKINETYKKMNETFIKLINLSKEKGMDTSELNKLRELYSGIVSVNHENIPIKKLRIKILKDYKRLFQSYCEYRYMETIDETEDDCFDLDELNESLFSMQKNINKLSNIYLYYIEDFEYIPKIFNITNNEHVKRETIYLFKYMSNIVINDEEEKYEQTLKFLRYLKSVFKSGNKFIELCLILYIFEYSKYDVSMIPMLSLLVASLSGEVIYRVVGSRLRKKQAVSLTKRLEKESNI